VGRRRPLAGPLLRLLAGGALLLAVARFGAPAPAPAHDAAADARVVVTADDIARLRALYVEESGLEPTPDDEAALVEQAIDEELLFREALARGLDDDPSVRRWLVQQMRALADDPDASDDELLARARALGLERRDAVVRRMLVAKMRLVAARSGEDEVRDADVDAVYASRRERYRLPDLVDLSHVFVATRDDPDAARARAERILAELRAAERAGTGVAHASADGGAADAGATRAPRSTAAGAARTLGDPFPLAGPLVGQSRTRLAQLFGEPFADAVVRATDGAWTGPLASAFGLHLVRVERRVAGETPALAEVRGRVAEDWLQERRGARLAALLAELRARYALEVESPAWRARRGT